MANWLDILFPITDPTWIFFLVLCIILFAPILLSRFNIPHIIGLIIAGVIIGEHGFHILDRDSSFELFGNVGLYYIMFLAGLEMDMANFKTIKYKAITFGLLGFILPMVMGYYANQWILGYSMIPAILMAAMYASHTLVSYPIVSRYGIARLRGVSIAVGGTAITDCLTLFVLAMVSSQFKEGAGGSFAILGLVARVGLLGGLIIYLFPRIGRWFFRTYSNGVIQFIFVLAMVFLSAGLMEVMGMEGILGAFLAGLVLNRLIPHVSPLMHNIEFVGNALFVPYFLIGVGMLIDVRAFFSGFNTLWVAFIMILLAISSKWITAFVTQKVCRLNKGERRLLFGLSTARAAATLAVVLVGYQIILPDGSHLLGEEVFNGAIALILVTCIVGSFVTENASRILAMDEGESQDNSSKEENEKILISVANPDTIEHLVSLSLYIRNPKLTKHISALNVVTDHNQNSKVGKRSLDQAVQMGSATGVAINPITRFDLNIASGIIYAQKEQKATDVIIGLHRKSNIMDTFLGGLTESLLSEIHREMLVVKMLMPLNTIRKIVVAVPPKAEYEAGFAKWVDHISRISAMLSCRVVFHGTRHTLDSIGNVLASKSLSDNVKYSIMESWDELTMLSADVEYDNLLVIVSSRRGSISYQKSFEQLPFLVSHYFFNNSLLMIYPDQYGEPANLQAFADPMSLSSSRKIHISWRPLRNFAAYLYRHFKKMLNQ